MRFDHFIRIIKVTGVLSMSHLLHVVLARYPNARFQGGYEEPGTVLIAIPDLRWNDAPQGPEEFFRGLCSSRVISGFRHKRYTDQEEVRR